MKKDKTVDKLLGRIGTLEARIFSLRARNRALLCEMRKLIEAQGKLKMQNESVIEIWPTPKRGANYFH